MDGMTCRECQMQLLDHLGFENLPADLVRHMEDCPECIGLWNELNGVAGYLGDQSLFAPTPAEAATMLVGVNRAIDAMEERSLFDWRTLVGRLVPLAASVILLLGLGLSGRWYEPAAPSPDTVTYVIDEYSLGMDLAAIEDQLDDRAVDLLVDEFSHKIAAEPSETLLEDLTAEEYEYLTQNFDIGDLL